MIIQQVNCPDGDAEQQPLPTCTANVLHGLRSTPDNAVLIAAGFSYQLRYAEPSHADDLGAFDNNLPKF